MASESDDERRDRLRMLVRENARRRHRPELMKELAAALGPERSVDDFLSLQATEDLQAAVSNEARFHLVFHRIWGDRLAGEVAMTLEAIADKVQGLDAYLLLRDPPEAVRVPASDMLRYTAAHLGRETDLTLITGDAESGLVLGWDHLAYADEYSLLTCGSFAFDITQ